MFCRSSTVGVVFRGQEMDGLLLLDEINHLSQECCLNRLRLVKAWYVVRICQEKQAKFLYRTKFNQLDLPLIAFG